MKRMMEDAGLGPAGLVALLMLVTVGSAVTGWVYEMGFYYLDSGGQWVARGHGMGPWLPIYGFGALAILLACWRMRQWPAIVFVLASLISGVVEFASGWVFYTFFDGLRLWDYNIEIWNWGNVGGFICARSVLLFGVTGMLVVCWLAPLAAALIRRVGERRMLAVCSIVTAIYAADIINGYLIKGL
jgi:uncharacterized membrane protein